VSDYQIPISDGSPYQIGRDFHLGEKYTVADMWADMGVDPAAESYIALRVAADGTRTEQLVKGGVLISERVLPDDEVWTGEQR